VAGIRTEPFDLGPVIEDDASHGRHILPVSNEGRLLDTWVDCRRGYAHANRLDGLSVRLHEAGSCIPRFKSKARHTLMVPIVDWELFQASK
jgi:hypothetical protein